MTSLRSLFAIAALAAAIALAPPALGADAAKTVICKDGATAQGGRGACRGHGGVDKAATARAEGGAAAAGAGQKASQAEDKAARKAKKAEEKAARKAKRAEEKGAERSGAGEATGPGQKVLDAAGLVTCKDGSTSKGGRGACRGHGGVDRAATARKAVPPAAPPATSAPPIDPSFPSAPSARIPTPPAAPPPASAGGTGSARQPDETQGPPTARCKDGTFSHAKHHTGACSRHGGVAGWLDQK